MTVDDERPSLPNPDDDHATGDDQPLKDPIAPPEGGEHGESDAAGVS